MVNAMNGQQTGAAKPQGPVVNWPLIICLSVSLPIELVLHDLRTFGVRSIPPRAAGAALLMFIFMAFHSNDNGAPLFCYMMAVILLSIIAQIVATVRDRRRAVFHSRYNGQPYLMWLLPWSEATIKRLEPFIPFTLGWCLRRFNHPLGSFLIAGAICLAITVALERMGNRERKLDINDALVSQTIALRSVRDFLGR
jgi:hypothetical protein